MLNSVADDAPTSTWNAGPWIMTGILISNLNQRFQCLPTCYGFNRVEVLEYESVTDVLERYVAQYRLHIRQLTEALKQHRAAAAERRGVIGGVILIGVIEAFPQICNLVLRQRAKIAADSGLLPHCRSRSNGRQKRRWSDCQTSSSGPARS